jgi:hypothetical protein
VTVPINESPDPEILALQQEYLRLCHAMQSGVLYHLHIEGTDDETSLFGAKHVRVGINSALIQNSALAGLLIEKGVITELEYWESQVDAWQREVALYENLLSTRMGVEVKLA